VAAMPPMHDDDLPADPIITQNHEARRCQNRMRLPNLTELAPERSADGPYEPAVVVPILGLKKGRMGNHVAAAGISGAMVRRVLDAEGREERRWKDEAGQKAVFKT
jgi:hypothetical protein